VEGYDAFQQNKNCTEQPVGKLMPNSILEKPWMHIPADFITKLPLAQGYDSILVVVNRLTKIVQNCMVYLRALSQIEDHNLQQD